MGDFLARRLPGDFLAADVLDFATPFPDVRSYFTERHVLHKGCAIKHQQPQKLCASSTFTTTAAAAVAVRTGERFFFNGACKYIVQTTACSPCAYYLDLPHTHTPTCLVKS